jgi:hypothetical protein
MTRIARLVPIAASMLLAGCVVLPPSGPSVQALPGSRMSFQQFQVDDAACRQHAVVQVGGKGAGEAAQESAAASVIGSTMLGAAAGGAFGGGSEGAAVGAVFGLLTGAMIGTGTAQSSYYLVQRSYDGAYYSCMYARGHRVPVSASYTESARVRAQPPAPAASAPPADAAIPPPNAPPPAATYFGPPPDAAVPPPNAPPPPATPTYVPPYWPNTPPRQ